MHASAAQPSASGWRTATGRCWPAPKSAVGARHRAARWRARRNVRWLAILGLSRRCRPIVTPARLKLALHRIAEAHTIDEDWLFGRRGSGAWQREPYSISRMTTTVA